MFTLDSINLNYIYIVINVPKKSNNPTETTVSLQVGDRCSMGDRIFQLYLLRNLLSASAFCPIRPGGLDKGYRLSPSKYSIIRSSVKLNSSTLDFLNRLKLQIKVEGKLTPLSLPFECSKMVVCQLVPWKQPVFVIHRVYAYCILQKSLI